MITRIAIVGSGFGMYCLLPAFSGIKGCEVVSICGKNSERMSNFCKKFNVKQYIDWKEMIHKEKKFLASTIEILALYVDLNERKVVEFEDEKVKLMDDFINKNKSQFKDENLQFSSKLKK